jgi:predicted  nucleic acid-binding Zn-ribbon protein
MDKTQSIIDRLRQTDGGWSELGELCAIAAYELEALAIRNANLNEKIQSLEIEIGNLKEELAEWEDEANEEFEGINAPGN